MKIRLLAATLVLNLALIAAHGTPAPSTHSMQRHLAACAACHGKHGRGGQKQDGGIYPRLAGQPPQYLYRQMLRFKALQRTGIPPVTAMQRLLAGIPALYLHLIAHYYHQLAPPYPSQVPSRTTKRLRGRELVQRGLPTQGIVSCTKCHGSNLQGRPPNVPALAGQYARYLQIQFAHWAQGARHSRLHVHIARTLSSAQVQAIATYLASLRPATANTTTNHHRRRKPSARSRK